MAAGIFIDLGNGIKGESVQEGFTDHIAASSLQWGVGRGISSFTNGVRETSSPNFSEMVFTKTFDISSNDIALAATKAVNLPTVKISLRKDDGAGGFVYLVYDLTDVYISGYSVSSGGDQPSESVSLNYRTITSTYKKLANSHADDGENEFTYDISAQV